MTTGSGRRSAVGRYGEDLAAQHLAATGMVVRARNWRCRQGEVDIVAVDGRCLVVVEVKTRTTLAYGSPAESVTPAKSARLRRLAAAWIAEHDVHPERVRVDVVGVLVPERGRPQVDHRRGVA